ncbi:hypothetical protein F5I97DRAFT_1829257 [Phlebopus sp. FC_14]|nr:hypothetical protein F5I97DRAFT_1829257 [Phlebopus sp. FC_14]
MHGTVYKSTEGAAAIAYDGVVYFSNFSDKPVLVALMRYNRILWYLHPFLTNGCLENANSDAGFAVHPENHDLTQTVITTLCVTNTRRWAVFALVDDADFYALGRQKLDLHVTYLVRSRNLYHFTFPMDSKGPRIFAYVPPSQIRRYSQSRTLYSRTSDGLHGLSDPYAILKDGTCAAFIAFRDGRKGLFTIDPTTGRQGADEKFVPLMDGELPLLW